METKDYVKIFRLDQENFKFNRREFMNKMGEDLLEVCQKQQKINPATGHISYSDFKKVVKHFEDKFNEISRQSIRPLSQNLWKAFFVTQVVPLRKLWYPETQKRIEEMRNNSSEQDKKSLRGKKGNDGKGNR